MIFLTYLTIFIKLLILPKILVYAEPDWTFDLVSVKVENYNPEKIFMDLHITHPSRGVYGLSGLLDFKEDLTDDLFVGVSIFYSMTGGSDFIKSPFNIPECKLSKFLNDFYKEILMEAVVECAENTPQTNDKFVMPLTKRVIKLNDCIISNENMPSKLRKGYYMVKAIYRKQAEGTVEFVMKVEPNN